METRSIALCSCALVVLAAAASGQKNELERISALSPFDGCVADDPASQPGTVTFDSEVEPWVAVDPNNADHVVASWQQDRWSTGGARGLVVGVSFDGGRSWFHVPLTGTVPCTGGAFLRASDPWVSFAPNGDLFHASLVVDEALLDFLGGEGDGGRSGILVHKSTDGGLTWTGPETVVDEDFAGLHDKQSITADPHDASHVYVTWDRADLVTGTSPAMFSRTTDGGATWSEPSVLHDPGPGAETVGNQILVLPDGMLLDFFTLATADGFQLAVKMSLDLGETWLPDDGVIVVSTLEPSLDLADPQTGTPIRGGEFLFDVAVDAQSGALYAVWQDARFNGGVHESVAFSASHDGGFTWSEPIEVNRTPADLPVRNQQAFVPSVAVNDKGDIAVTYYDFRFDGAEPEALTDYWAVVCRTRGGRDCTDPASWDAEMRVTDESFDMLAAPLAGGLFLGDYAGLAAAGKDFVAVFAIAATTDPASVFSRRFRKGAHGR